MWESPNFRSAMGQRQKEGIKGGGKAELGEEVGKKDDTRGGWLTIVVDRREVEVAVNI